MAEKKDIARQPFKTRFISYVVSYKNGSQVLVEHQVTKIR